MLYNPVNANVDSLNTNINNKFISNSIPKNTENSPKVEQVKNEDKPIINIKPEDIKSESNLISDDEFFDDFFGD